MILTIILTTFVTFVSGFILAVFLQSIKYRKTKNKLIENLKISCKDIIENYKVPDLKIKHAYRNIMFPQIEQIIYSGMLHYFNFEIQDKMAQILMQQKALDYFIKVIIEQSFTSNGENPSDVFKKNYENCCKEFMNDTKKLLKLLE